MLRYRSRLTSTRKTRVLTCCLFLILLLDRAVTEVRKLK